MLFDDGPAKPQAQPSAGRLGRDEDIEDMLHFLKCDADAVIADFN